jgi:hypothetical protein
MVKRTQSIKSLRTDVPPRARDLRWPWNLRLASTACHAIRRATHGCQPGISFAQFGLMAEIPRSADDTVSALAERMGLDQVDPVAHASNARGEGSWSEIATVESDQR